MNERLDNNSLKLLKVFNKHQYIHFQQLEDRANMSQDEAILYLSRLLKMDLVENTHPLKQKDKTVGLEQSYKITLDGKAYLDERRTEEKRFKIQSIYVPILVAFVTAILTAYFTTVATINNLQQLMQK